MTEEDLPDAELEVLACIWHQGRPTAREIREAIAGYRPLAHASVTTLLKRLEERGHIRRERGPVGKAFVYEAVRHPRPTQKKLVRQMVERIFGGSSVALVASLFETRPPDAREVAELQAMLDQLSVSRSKGKTGTEDARKKRAGRRST
jgi:BlaI family penicillinase repressor